MSGTYCVQQKDINMLFPQKIMSTPIVKPTQGEAQAATESNGLVWRLDSDLDIVCYKRKLMPLCEFMKKLATENGLGWVEMENHVVTQKYHEAVAAWVGFNLVG